MVIYFVCMMLKDQCMEYTRFLRFSNNLDSQVRDLLVGGVALVIKLSCDTASLVFTAQVNSLFGFYGELKVTSR